MTRFVKLTLWLLFLVFGLIFLGISLNGGLDGKETKSLISALKFTEKFAYNFEESPLRKIVKDVLKDKEGEYAIFIETLNPDKKEQYALNEHKVYPSASLYKLFLMAAVYQAIEQEKFSEKTVLSISEKHLIDILGGKEFGYEETEEDSKISYTVEQAMYRVATISDNYAALMLAEKVGWDNVQSQAKKVGVENTTIKTPITTTASDIALFFRKLYQGEVVSKQSSEKIITILSESRLNNRIPKYLPKSIKIAHKTGELSKVRHDAGIVFLEGNPYLVVVMATDLKGEDLGVKTIAELSKNIYEYFASKASASPSPKQ